MDDEVATLGDYVEELDHDLGEVEEYLYDEDCCDDECDCCEDDCDTCDCCCDEEYECFEASCPHCGEDITFDCEIEQEELVCPACGKKFVDQE